MSVPHAKVIVNPAAGGYSVHREWPRIRKQLWSVGLSFDYQYSEGVGHAIEVAKASINAGYRYLVAVGGDGTINEVANGILCSTASASTILGVVSAGTACSFARSLGIPQNCLSACSVLTGQRRRLIDVGFVEYKSGGQSLQRFFVNEADVGFCAEVVQASKDIPGNFGRSINYAPFVVAAVRCLFSYQSKRLILRVENDAEASCLCRMVVIANGNYFGGGMRIAPQAKPDDGLLDMIIVGDVEKSELVKIWLMSYEGTHITHNDITVKRITNVAIQSSERVLLETDGELIGECPVSFRIIPSALTIVV
jgi:diacylglycerol kinase (ATP)